MMKHVVILGATGSVGKNALDVLARHPDQFSVLALSANTKVDALIDLIKQFHPKHVAVASEKEASVLNAHVWENVPSPQVHIGPEGLCELACLPDATHVIAAVVGAAGLPSCVAAAKHGKTILLANKEALVMGGVFFLDAVRQGKACLLPLDSEHNALFQCLPQGAGRVDTSVRSVWLTASGGPFLNYETHQLKIVTPDQACKHPKWSMGRKISVDSATLMNKGLEVIEAALLYGISAEKIKVSIHPQSTVHALVQYLDGSVLAHLSHPDMRVPIAHALAYPERIASAVEDLDICNLQSLHFEAPNMEKFPCLGLAYQALNEGHVSCISLNAANEVAVQAFLDSSIGFLDIANVVEQTMSEFRSSAQPASLDDIYQLDNRVREWANSVVDGLR